MILSFDSAYNAPHHLARHHLCKTNTPSPTAMRGFGRPQTIFAVENAINDIADTLDVRPETVS